MPAIPHQVLLPAVSLLVACGTAHADSASGGLTLGDKRLAPPYASAFRIRDSFHPGRRLNFVMLTATPVQGAQIAADTNPYGRAINDPAVRHADWLGFDVDEAGVVRMNARVAGVQYVDSSAAVFGTPGALLADCRHNTPRRVACHVRTRAPVQSMDGGTWSLDVRFDAEVLARAPGKPVPPGGGAPGRAFLALLQALDAGELDTVLALLVDDLGELSRADYQSPEENLASVREGLAYSLPLQPRIAGGELLDDDHALLEVEGVPYEGARFLYEVEMRRVDGQWRFARSLAVGMYH